MDVYKAILEELLERRCQNVQSQGMFYAVATGAHLFNLMNQRKYIYVEAGRLVDTRLHILFVTVPGFGKTFWIEMFCRGDQALLAGSGIDVVFEQSMTEAAFVGTQKFQNGEIITIPGLAEQHKYAIIGVEEFSAITNMFRTNYSSQLDVALLSSLDSGWVKKRLAPSGEAPIEYKTYFTLFAGVQPARYDLSSGLGRRFLFLTFVPGKSDFQQMKLARRGARGQYYNLTRTQRIREGINRLRLKLNSVEEVAFDDSVDKTLDELDLMHFEEQLFERIVIGYNVMRGNFDKTLRLTVDDECKRLLQTAALYRKQVQRGAQYMVVLECLRDLGGSAELRDLYDRLVKYGMDWKESGSVLEEMFRLRMIRVVGGKVSL